MPRHRRAWHARAKAPAHLACPCQGTSVLGVLNQGTGAVCPRQGTNTLRRAHAKAPTRAACPCQGTTKCLGWCYAMPFGILGLVTNCTVLWPIGHVRFETRLAPWSTILGCYLPSQRSHFKDIHTRHPPLGLCMRECLSVVGSVESHLAPLGKWMDGRISLGLGDLVPWHTAREAA
ncbi:hypothetical protein QYF36_017840 [Acer negundo]|nr:hypothetical protein QYF36_017840 [Acer negundo]